MEDTKFKRLKDPIYGYIEIPSLYINNIVDTSSFQRLRRIIQTSYSPLYASAVHNRFVHSLGVYHLGKIASSTIKREIVKKTNEVSLNIDSISELFMLACLLHDVGHAPFSHTGEIFFLDNGEEGRKPTKLHEKLINLVGSKSFEMDVPKEVSKSAAPHELVSAIVALKDFGVFFCTSEDKEFFARCITGYKYTSNNKDDSLKNCFISLLNSKVIDVDKLDYLLRDAFVTGFDTISIDYSRLLTSLTITLTSKEKYELAYNKNAISVIENVVYAHDAERKWIQNHPVILYESYILRHIMNFLDTEISTVDRPLFSIDSLGNEGQHLKDDLYIRLLCDDDVIYLIKNVFHSYELSEEFFDRRKRRHPLWKSEAEYKSIILNKIKGGDVLFKFEEAMNHTVKYLNQSSDTWVICDELIEKVNKDLSNLDSSGLDPDTILVQKSAKEMILKITRCLKNYADELHQNFSFVILAASQFNSGFGKPDFSAIHMVFPTNEGESVVKFQEVASSISAKSADRDNFFYLYYKRGDKSGQEIDPRELCRRLLREFV